MSSAINFGVVGTGAGAGGGGVIASDWISFTPSLSAGFGTTTNNAMYYRRVGDSMQIKGTFVTGSVTNTVAYLTIPGSYTIDVNKMATSTNQEKVGTWYSGTGSTVASYIQSGPTFYDGSTNNQIFFSQSLSTTLNKGNVSTAIAGNTTFITMDITVPISGWTTNSATTYPGSTKSAWSGYQTITTSWTTASATFAAPTTSGTVTTTSTAATGISAANYGTNAGITCTLPATGYYMIYANVNWTTSLNNTGSLQLVDGSGTIINKGIAQVNITNQYSLNNQLIGLYNATTTSPSFQIYMANNGSGTATIQNAQNPASTTATNAAINWTIVQL